MNLDLKYYETMNSIIKQLGESQLPITMINHMLKELYNQSEMEKERYLQILLNQQKEEQKINKEELQKED